MAKPIEPRYDRWRVIGPDPSLESRVICECDCGTIRSVNVKNLKQGQSRSCGCSRIGPRTHGYSSYGRKTPEYRIWLHLKQRCVNPKDAAYKSYGARGISVSLEWRSSFETFLADMGPRPGPGYSIDRIDNNGNYEKGNCQWATPREQSRNTRRNINLTFNGRTQTAAEWAYEVGISIFTMYGRLKRGWAAERAIATPAREKAQSRRGV